MLVYTKYIIVTLYVNPPFTYCWVTELEDCQLCVTAVVFGLVNHSSEGSRRMAHPHMHLKNLSSFISVLTDSIKFDNCDLLTLKENFTKEV